MKAEFNDVDLGNLGMEDSVGFEEKVKLDAGDNTLRLLPPWRKGGTFYKAFKQHFNLIDLRAYGLEVDGWYSEPCLGEVTEVHDDGIRVLSKPCPICKIANKAYSLGQVTKNPELVNLGKRLRHRRQYAVNAVHYESDASKVKVYVFGKKIFDSLKTIFTKHKNITNPITGRAITVVKKEIPGQSYFDYAVLPDDPSDISELWTKEYAKQLHDLDQFPPYNSYEEIEAKLVGVSVGENAGNNSLDDFDVAEPHEPRFTDPLDAA